MDQVVQIDEARIQGHLGNVVCRQSMRPKRIAVRGGGSAVQLAPEEAVCRGAWLNDDLLEEAMAKNCEAISTPGDGQGSCGQRAHEYPARLPDLHGERSALPVPGQGRRREREDRGLAGMG